MPDPTTTTAAVATAAAGAAGAAVTGAGIAFGVPLPVIVAAVFGATVGAQRIGQLELTVRGCGSSPRRSLQPCCWASSAAGLQAGCLSS